VVHHPHIGLSTEFGAGRTGPVARDPFLVFGCGTPRLRDHPDRIGIVARQARGQYVDFVGSPDRDRVANVSARIAC